MPMWRNWQTQQVESLPVVQTVRDRCPPSVPHTLRSWRNWQTQWAQTPPPDSNMRASEIVARRAHHRVPPAEGNLAYLADSESAASAFESQAGDHCRRQAHGGMSIRLISERQQVRFLRRRPAIGASSNGRAAALQAEDECSTHSAPTIDVREHVQMCVPLMTGR